MKKPLILGFGFTKRVGKDYSANLLTKHYRVRKFSFAEPLKKDISDLLNKYGLDYSELEKDPKIKEIIRPLLVCYGETVKKLVKNVWLNTLINKLNTEDFSNVDIVVITDVRFLEEVEALKEKGAYIIHLYDDGEIVDEIEKINSQLCADRADFKLFNSKDKEFDTALLELVNELIKKGGN